MIEYDPIAGITEIEDLRDLARDMKAENARLRKALIQTKATLEKTDKYGGLLSIGAAKKIIKETLEQKP